MENPSALPTETLLPPLQPRRKAVVLTLVLTLAALGGLFLLGYLPSLRHRSVLAVEARQQDAAPRVRVATPRPAKAETQLKLPGTVSPLKETVIYARTSGYLRRWYVDIGEPVKAGQLLADIDTPEVDQQLLQAQATLAQTQAGQEQARTDLEFARISAERVVALQPAGVASRQDLDQKQAEYQAARAKLHVAESVIRGSEANVQRLKDLKSFSRVLAPFAGTITMRSTEVGSLVTAGSGSGQQLFRLAMTSPVRVFVNVPQHHAPSVRVGQAARITVREFPDRVFPGQVTHTAQSLDAATHTLLTEVQVQNEDGTLLGGTYAQVELAVPLLRKALLLDATALVLSADGPTVAVVQPGDKVHFQKVVIDVDYGGEVALSSGLQEDDRVVMNPGERLSEGGVVTVVR